MVETICHPRQETLFCSASYIQEGLSDDIKGPAVSGAESYKSLCIAAKNEEKRLAELVKRVQYRKESQQQKPSTPKGPMPTVPKPSQQGQDGAKGKRWKCHKCGDYGHMARECKAPKKESSGKSKGQNGTPAKTNVVDSRPVNHNDPEAICIRSLQVVRALFV